MTKTEPWETTDSRKRSARAPTTGIVRQTHTMNNFAYSVEGEKKKSKIENSGRELEAIRKNTRTF